MIARSRLARFASSISPTSISATNISATSISATSISLGSVIVTVTGVVAVLSCMPARGQEAAHRLPKRIVADYVYWSKYQKPPYSHAEIPYSKVTHINHAGISFNADGSLSVPDGFIEPELNNRAHAAGVKVMLLLGGDFAGLETTGAVQALVDNVAAFEKQYAYDGV